MEKCLRQFPYKRAHTIAHIRYSRLFHTLLQGQVRRENGTNSFHFRCFGTSIRHLHFGFVCHNRWLSVGRSVGSTNSRICKKKLFFPFIFKINYIWSNLHINSYFKWSGQNEKRFGSERRVCCLRTRSVGGTQFEGESIGISESDSIWRKGTTTAISDRRIADGKRFKFFNSEKSKGRSVSFHSCRVLRALDPSLISGMHWIDLDGQGVGDNSIFVYCGMTKGIYCLTEMRTN